MTSAESFPYKEDDMEFFRNLNLPNRLTLLRVIMVPVFVFFILIAPENMACRVIAALIFIAASLTDMADGMIARRYDMITNFGKFMDPLADKLLVCSAMICLVSIGKLPAWICIIIIAREFIISGFRLVASDNGIVIAASYWGKFKTVFQMLMVITMVFDFKADFWQLLEMIFMWAALLLTIVSLVDYIVKNKSVLSENK